MIRDKKNYIHLEVKVKLSIFPIPILIECLIFEISVKEEKISQFLHKRPYKIKNTYNDAICHDKLSENILVIDI